MSTRASASTKNSSAATSRPISHKSKSIPEKADASKDIAREPSVVVSLEVVVPQSVQPVEEVPVIIEDTPEQKREKFIMQSIQKGLKKIKQTADGQTVAFSELTVMVSDVDF